MNYLDLAILLIFAFFILHSFYKGFLCSVFAVASFFLSWLGATIFSPLVAEKIFSYKELTDMMLYYTEGAENIHNIELAKLNVSGLSASKIDEILNNSTLHPPLDNLVRGNLTGEVFKNSGLISVGQYFNQTIVAFTVNVISFIAVFFLLRVIFSLIIGCVDYLKLVPKLKHFDSMMGVGLGVVNGFFTVFVIFMLLPIILTTIPFTFIHDYVNSSFFGSFFYNSNFLLTLIKGG